MFNLHDFVFGTVKGMIGNYPDWQVQEYALNWFNRSVLTETDLAEIATLIAAKNYVPPVEELSKDEAV